MARRVGTWLVGSAGWLIASSLTGCYSHHTADEELINIPFPAEVYGDAGVAAKASDASTHDAGSCTGTNAIETFLCGLGTQPTTGNTGGTAGTNGANGTGTPNLTDLISLFGGGNTGTTGTGSTGQLNLTDLISLFGGNTGTTTQNPFGGTGTTTRRDAGVGMTRAGGLTTMPTAAECAAPADQLTQLLCMMQQGRGNTTTPPGRTMMPTTPPATTPAAVDAAVPVVEADAAMPI